MAVAIFALWINPPDLLRVAANYSAKIVCSNVFLAGRGLALARPTTGCAAIPDGNAATTNPTLERLLADDTLAGPGMRAIVVIDHGRLVAVSDITRMLYLQPNAAGVARAKLFDLLGMTGATMETDEDGTLVGSSYLYATARDWARYGQFLLQEGVWRGQALLPAGYVAMMTKPVAASTGQYGHGLIWLWGSDAAVPGKNPDTALSIPTDTFWMKGHDGQSIAIIPSRQLVIVRLGLTPSRARYQPQPLIKAILALAPQ
jgi:hypothetical protein